MKTKFFTVFIILIFACCTLGQAQGSGNAMSFSFNESQYVGGNVGFSDLTAVTIESWAYVPEYSTAQFVCGSDFFECYEIHVSPGGSLRFIPSGVSYFDTPAGSCPTSQWFHLACTYTNAGECHIYINGISVAVINSSGQQNPLNNAPSAIAVGRRGNPFYFPFIGKIDEFRIWNTARTATEIRENMCRKIPGNTAGLITYYRFDETDGNVIIDQTGNGNGVRYGNLARVTSGAPIGDYSSCDYVGATPAQFSVTMAHPQGTTFSATGSAGTYQGLQVYMVDQLPNNALNHPPAWLGLERYYFGVFPVGTGTQYTATYNYLAEYVDVGILLGSRARNDVSDWTDNMATIDRGLNTLTKTGETGNEYIMTWVVAIPTMTEWSLYALGALLVALSAWVIVRKM